MGQQIENLVIYKLFIYLPNKMYFIIYKNGYRMFLQYNKY